MKREPFKKVQGVPWWMNTRPGRWLCIHWHPAATLWDALMNVRVHDAAKTGLAWCRVDLERAANQCVCRDFNEESRAELTRAWRHWRDARDAEHRVAEALTRRVLHRDELESPS